MRGSIASALPEELRVNELRVCLGGLAHARTRPVDEVRIDREDAVVLYRGDDRPALPPRDIDRLRGVRVRRENDDLGIASEDLLGGELRVRRRRAGRDVHAPGDVDEVVDV